MTKQELKQVIEGYVKEGKKIPFNTLTSNGIEPTSTVNQYCNIDETHSKANAVAELLESPYEFWLAYWNVNEKIKNWQSYTLIGFNANELLVMDLICNYNELLGKIPKPDISFLTEKYYC